ncbi:MAG: PHP domain-containing protein [Ruminococcaceae bacterium]|nr:PHP domain-containing protein [Oscillospiraceae bacterium]
MIKDIFGNTRYKAGLHIHTTLSDGARTPKEAVEIYKNAGYDVVAITDHWEYYSNAEINGVKIISGIEFNTGGADTSDDVMHIVALGMNKAPELSRNASRQEIIDTINENGGLAVLAHPAWSLNTLEDVMSLNGFFATEIYNTVSDVGQSRRGYSGYIVDALANKGVFFPLVAADDVHFYQGEDETKSYVMVKAGSSSQCDILKALKNGDFYATQGPELHLTREGDKMIARCSKSVEINFISNSSYAPDRVITGEDLTYAEYPIKEWERWIRLEVKDKEGRYGWSNIIRI